MTAVVDRRVPEHGTREYEWWLAGAAAEAEARKEGRTSEALEVVEFVDALAEHRHDLNRAEMVAYAFTVYAADLSVWRRIRLLWRYRVFRGRWFR